MLQAMQVFSLLLLNFRDGITGGSDFVRKGHLAYVAHLSGRVAL